jgi:transposase
MTQISTTHKTTARRRYSPEFKARIVTACQQPGASVAAIARSHDLNANMVHKWIRLSQSSCTQTPPAFIALPVSTLHQTGSQPLPVASPSSVIRLEYSGHHSALVVSWPADQAESCIRLLRELLQ